ncbi:MAG: hypothetical protein JRI34_13755 [Deltaproteobacteria bacterium]|nr:hypothetical protein [Deltaproteobacteria bacterium]
MRELESRIEALENKLRIMYILLSIFVLVLVAMAFIAALPSPEIQEIVRCRKLEVLDTRDKVRVELRAGYPQEAPYLSGIYLKNALGKEVVLISPEGVYLKHAGEEETTSFSRKGIRCRRLAVLDPLNNERIVLYTGGSGRGMYTSGIHIIDENDNLRASLIHSDNGSGLHLGMGKSFSFINVDSNDAVLAISRGEQSIYMSSNSKSADVILSGPPGNEIKPSLNLRILHNRPKIELWSGNGEKLFSVP